MMAESVSGMSFSDDFGKKNQLWLSPLHSFSPITAPPSVVIPVSEILRGSMVEVPASSHTGPLDFHDNVKCGKYIF